MSGPQPGTPTPWSMDALNPGEIELTGAPSGFCADIIGHIKDWSADNAEANAAAIVHRMNNWDAVVADNAALKAKNEALVEALDVMTTFAEGVIRIKHLKDTNGICAASRKLIAQGERS